MRGTAVPREFDAPVSTAALRGCRGNPRTTSGGPQRKPGALCHYVLMPQLPRDPDERPPFLGTWRRVYTAILIYLGLLIGAFYLFTRAYR